MTNTLIAIVTIAVGVISCFYGYRFFRVVLVFLGFIIGFSIGSSLVADRAAITFLLVGLGAGLIGAALMYGLYSLGVALAGALLGASIASSIVVVLNLDNIAWIVILAGLVIGALIAFALRKWIIILSTAFSGSSSILYGLGLLIPSLSFLEDRSRSPIAFIAWIVLALIGASTQYYRFRDELD